MTVTQRYVFALDQGATSSRAMLFGRDGRVGRRWIRIDGRR
jgi:glycerol kinase